MKKTLLITFFSLAFVAQAQITYTIMLNQTTATNIAVINNGIVLDTCNNSGQVSLPTALDFEQAQFVHIQTQQEYDATILPNLQIIELQSRAIEAVLIQAVNAPHLPFASSSLSAEQLQKQNLGKDIPMLLNILPSAVVSSDAGNGVGYTDLRIRGTDGTRTNVTVNGVPINDAESHGTYWVNMPDLVSSASSIQVQRGAGTSVNGAGAFGASINIQTQSLDNAFAFAATSYGSFNTVKNTIGLGTGLLNNKWNLDLRLSQVNSNGFIDRSATQLSSYMLGITYKQNNLSIKYLSFGGAEQTNQAWYGVPIEKYKDTGLRNHYNRNVGTVYNGSQDSANLFNSAANTYNYYTYPNEIDKYSQLHNHLYISKTMSLHSAINVTLYSTVGKGYFEQYKANDNLSSYGYVPSIIGTDTFTQSNVIRQRWLDNNLLGLNANYTYKTLKSALVLGLGVNNYMGNHFGKLIWANLIPTLQPNKTYYNGTGDKVDANVFVKWNSHLTNKIAMFADAQVRSVQHKALGIDNDLRNITFSMKNVFFNPKVGANYKLTKYSKLYYSASLVQKEPARNDYSDNKGKPTPQPEQLLDHELGYSMVSNKLNINSNMYYMDYKNQLILTGAINDVGNALRQNIANSYRLGWENQVEYLLASKCKLGANITISRNKIKEFTAVWLDYSDFSEVKELLKNKDIAQSPNLIGMAHVAYRPISGLELNFIQKYVSKQYLDNTQNKLRSLPAFTTGELWINYSLATKNLKKLSFQMQIGNIFNTQYASRAYTFGHYNTPTSFTQEVYVYPQAGRTMLAGVRMDF